MGEMARQVKARSPDGKLMNTASHQLESFEALVRSGRLDEAAAAAERIMPVIRANAHALYLYGVACATIGALPKAAEALSEAARMRPNDPACIGALARVLFLLGASKEAEAQTRLLSALAKDSPAAAESLIEVNFQCGRFEDAFAYIEEASRRFPQHSFDAPFAEAAIRTRRTDIGIEAATRAERRLGTTAAVVNIAGPAALLADDREWLRRLTALIDTLPRNRAAMVYDSWTRILVAPEHLAAAKEAAELAAAAESSGPRWRIASDLRLALRDHAGAEDAARRALAHDANDANAMSLLARCRLFAGDVAGAKALFEQAVEIDPGNAVAFDNLTQLDPLAMSATMAAHLERLLAENQLPGDAQPKALLALARRDEATNEYERAFNRVIKAKSLIAASTRAAGRAYRPEKTEEALSTLKRLFPHAIDGVGGAEKSPRPIFIVGMPRSGTTLAEQILASHPSAFGAGELPQLAHILREFTPAAERLGAAAALDARSKDWIEIYFQGLPAESFSREAVVDKHPLNFWGVGLILALFPDARVINMKRSAVDTCLSILRLRFFADYDFANEIDAVAHYFSAYERMTAHWRALFGARILDLGYEALVAEPERNARALLAHCGLNWDPACLAFHAAKRSVMTHSAAQVREPINRQALERRAKYGDALKPLENALMRFGVQTR